MDRKADRPKFNITEHPLLVDLNKSKKLAAMVKKPSTPLPCTSKTIVFSAGQSETDTALQQARQLIDERIYELMSRLPEGRRNKLFAFRFGSIEAIQALEIKTAFKKLAISSHELNMRLLVSLNYHGDTV